MNIKNQFISIVLGAGKGTRMKSNIPKILHSINNKSLIYWVFKVLKKVCPFKNILVIGHQAEYIKNFFEKEDEILSLNIQNLEFALQEKQLGSGDALKIALKNIDENYNGNILVVCGDTPLLKYETLKKLIDVHLENNSAVSILTTKMDNPYGYGRMKRDENGKIMQIIEEKNASINEKEIKEINSGVYCFDFQFLKQNIKNIKPNDCNNEYYLTDIVNIAYNQNKYISSFCTKDTNEIIGINDKLALSQADSEIRRRINNNFMLNGVEMINPETIELDDNIKIGIDTIIYPGTIIRGNSSIGDNCKIGPNSFLENSIIGNNTTVKYSYISDAIIGNECSIGPFSHIRPKTKILDDCKVGNFSEIKNSVLEKGTKVSHLSYIGDSELGKNVNIGAGTITCNYDGKNKHKTIIKSNSFIGSNTNLVAPVVVGENSLVGAGSTIYQDVPDNSLAIERNEQKNKKDWIKNRKS